MKNKDCYVVRHPYAEIFFGASLIYNLFCIWTSDASSLTEYIVPTVVIVIFYAAWILAYCRGFILDPEGVRLCFFGITVRKLEWSQVRNVIVFHRVLRVSQGLTRGALLFIPHTCPKFRIGEDGVVLYSVRHFFLVLSFRFSPGKAGEYAAAVRKYYPHVKEVMEHC